MLGRLLCLIGLHHWVLNQFSGLLVPLNGGPSGRVYHCNRCSKSKYREPQNDQPH